MKNKSYCEDLTEGKFSFPIIHAILADTSNRQLLSMWCSVPYARTDDIWEKVYGKANVHTVSLCKRIALQRLESLEVISEP